MSEVNGRQGIGAILGVKSLCLQQGEAEIEAGIGPTFFPLFVTLWGPDQKVHKAGQY